MGSLVADSFCAISFSDAVCCNGVLDIRANIISCEAKGVEVSGGLSHGLSLSPLVAGFLFGGAM